jgi:hypothetical protein
MTRILYNEVGKTIGKTIETISQNTELSTYIKAELDTNYLRNYLDIRKYAQYIDAYLGKKRTDYYIT